MTQLTKYYAHAHVQANPFTLPSPPNSNSSYCGSPESHMTQGQMMGGSPDIHVTQQSPLVGDLNDSVHAQSYKLSPPYTPYAEVRTYLY